MSEPTVLTDDNFSTEVLNTSLPVLVDFWATWCGPCRMIAPIVQELSSEYEGRAKVCKLDVDEAQKTAAGFGIRSIPTLRNSPNTVSYTHLTLPTNREV